MRGTCAFACGWVIGESLGAIAKACGCETESDATYLVSGVVFLFVCFVLFCVLLVVFFFLLFFSLLWGVGGWVGSGNLVLVFVLPACFRAGGNWGPQCPARGCERGVCWRTHACTSPLLNCDLLVEVFSWFLFSGPSTPAHAHTLLLLLLPPPCRALWCGRIRSRTVMIATGLCGTFASTLMGLR